MKDSERRKSYFITKSFQASFIIKFCLLVTVGSLLSGVIIYTLSKETVTTSFENLRLVIKSTADFILPSVLLSSAAVIFAIGLAAMSMTLYTTHRIAGPLYRLEKDLEDVAQGNLAKKFHLREKDEIKALGEGLQTAIDSLRKNAENAKACLRLLDQELSQQNISSPNIKSRMNNLKDALDRFQT